MKRYLGPALAFILSACIGHAVLLYSAPGFIMAKALARMERAGVPLHGMYQAPRVNPRTQTVVRPSPDLAYSICRFDLAQAPHGVTVHMAAYPAYSSISFFDEQTNNFAVERGNSNAVTIRLMLPNKRASGSGVINATSDRGLILIRRLAPDQASFDRAAEAGRGDYCRAV